MARSASSRLTRPRAQALGDIGALPPAGQRRQIVRRGAGDRKDGIIGGSEEIEAAPLEPEHAHARHIGARELLAKTLGHGAEILADDHALAALALQRDLADQVVDGIGEIGALGGSGAVGDNE